jgi:hypothetical protein
LYADALIIDMDDSESEKKLKSDLVKYEEFQSEKPEVSPVKSEKRVTPVKESVEEVPERSKVLKR